MARFSQFIGSPDIFEKTTGKRITEEEAQTAGIFTPQGLSPEVQQIKTPRPDIKAEADFARLAGASLPPVSSISEPVASPQAGTSAPELPKPEAPTITDNYLTSITTDLANKRKTLEDTYNKQIKDLETKQAATQKSIDEFTAKQKDIIEEKVQPILTPFREEKEKAERERLKVEENYFANQTLTNELDTLLTEGNNLIKQQKETTGLAAIRNPRIAQTISDVSARAGVIQAVMSARSGRIAEAYKLIDRSIDAINADRQDQLTYYTTLSNFYEKQKDKEGKKLISLTTDQKSFLDKQITLLENDLVQSQANAENIKKAMADPDKAFAYAQVGVTLNDSLKQINQKLADYAYSKEIKDTSVKMAEKGYSYLALGQSAPDGSKAYTITDSKGIQKQWYEVPEKKAGVGDKVEQLYSGLSSSTATAVRAKVNKFSTEPMIQNFATIQDGYTFASSISDITTNPADDQALIYSLAKALDPGSVVREGEYATAQKYAQSWVKAYGKGVTQAILGTGFLSEEARKNIKQTIKQKYEASNKSYENLYSQYTKGINNLTGRIDGEKFLVDYSTPIGGFGEELPPGLSDEEAAKIFEQETGVKVIGVEPPASEITEPEKPEQPKYTSFKGLEITPPSFNLGKWFGF